jgi:hypothetical protein
MTNVEGAFDGSVFGASLFVWIMNLPLSFAVSPPDVKGFLKRFNSGKEEKRNPGSGGGANRGGGTEGGLRKIEFGEYAGYCGAALVSQ